MKEIVYYCHTNGKEPVKIWLKTLDYSIYGRIISRLTRVEDGNFGDFKRIDDEICELRFKFGSGYRIYYSEIGDIVILLLCAGDKSSQSKDIKIAKEYLELWRQNNEQI